MKPLVAGLGVLLVLPVFALAGVSGASIGPLPLPDGDLAAEVLAHPNIKLSPGAASDIRAEVADVRLLSVLLLLAEGHTLDWVGPIRTGHSYYVRGTRRVSNHVFGRALDIGSVDGTPVSASNLGALNAAKFLLSLPDPLRPDEVGSPWRLPGRGSFTNGDHRDHIHLGWS